ncbi:hypothetical protein [Paraburkholderia dipogonis]|jgi:hypothetical protein|uniref:hypothetical protein n=1 Tax=Paraburkholderia dipogonis TaxID=1211383 RepID=UPI0038BC7A5B
MDRAAVLLRVVVGLAFDVFDLPTALKVWFSRAVVAMVIGVVALHIGGKRAEAL